MSTSYEAMSIPSLTNTQIQHFLTFQMSNGCDGRHKGYRCGDDSARVIPMICNYCLKAFANREATNLAKSIRYLNQIEVY